MQIRTLSFVTLAAVASCLFIGISPYAQGEGEGEHAGEVCMPTEQAIEFARYDLVPVWWSDEEEEYAEGGVPQALIDDCMENGLLVLDGDIAVWEDSPSYEDCMEYAQDWWNDGTISSGCRDAGKARYWACMATMKAEDPDGLWMEHENICDRAGETCALDCERGNPGGFC